MSGQGGARGSGQRAQHLPNASVERFFWQRAGRSDRQGLPRRSAAAAAKTIATAAGSQELLRSSGKVQGRYLYPNRRDGRWEDSRESRGGPGSRGSRVLFFAYVAHLDLLLYM